MAKDCSSGSWVHEALNAHRAHAGEFLMGSSCGVIPCVPGRNFCGATFESYRAETPIHVTPYCRVLHIIKKLI